MFTPNHSLYATKDSFLTSLSLILLVTISVFTTDLYLSSFPHLVEYFNTTSFTINFTMSAYLIGFALSMIVCAPLADTFGMRNIILFGLALYSFASLMCIFSFSIYHLIIARFLQSFGACSGSILSRVIVHKHYVAKERIKLFSYLFIGLAIAIALAQLFGNYLFLYFGWKASFIFMTGYSAFILLIAYHTLPRHEKSSNNNVNFIKKYFIVLTNREFIYYTFVVTFLWMGFLSFVARAPFIFMVFFGTSIKEFGTIYSLTVCGFIIGCFLAKYFRSKIEVQAALAIGTTISLFAAISLWCSMHFYANSLLFAILMALYLSGLGIILPYCQEAISQIFESFATSAFSMLYFIKMLAAALGGMFIASVDQESIFPLIMMIVFCALSAKFINIMHIRALKTQ
jgi:DHA1 family bicyclomycin/chloramphenicol resistance-like MFS transporter